MARKLKIQVPEFIMAPMSDDFRYHGRGSPEEFMEWERQSYSLHEQIRQLWVKQRYYAKFKG